MSHENVEKLKNLLAAILVGHEKMVNHEILPTMQVPVDYIREKWPDEINRRAYGGGGFFLDVLQCP